MMSIEKYRLLRDRACVLNNSADIITVSLDRLTDLSTVIEILNLISVDGRDWSVELSVHWSMNPPIRAASQSGIRHTSYVLICIRDCCATLRQKVRDLYSSLGI